MSQSQCMQAIVMEPIGCRCEICGELFRKPHLLRLHERKLHDIVRPEVVTTTVTVATTPAPPAPPPPPPSITTVVIPAIQTAAMGVARARGEIPFAVLHMINEIPLIVRVLDQGEFSILKAAENGDFREAQRGSSSAAPPPPKKANSYNIAVVATIYQKINEQGQTCFVVSGPVSCDQAENVPPLEEQLGGQPQQQTADGVMQDSLGSADLYKTLTQINTMEPKKPQRVRSILRPSEVPGPVPSTSGINRLKRKTMVKTSQPQQKQHQQPSQQPPPPLAKRPRPLPQPKVITVVDNPSGGGGGGGWGSANNKAVVITATSGQQLVSKRNFQDVVTGSLLSPVRNGNIGSRKQIEDEVICVDDQEDQEDPFADIDMLDLIRTGNDDEPIPIHADMDIDGGSGDGLFISIV